MRRVGRLAGSTPRFLAPDTLPSNRPDRETMRRELLAEVADSAGEGWCRMSASIHVGDLAPEQPRGAGPRARTCVESEPDLSEDHGNLSRTGNEPERLGSDGRCLQPRGSAAERG